jgi:phosphotransferase system  glucose/maltose/N-acetylglucosamine-specific IIC component
MFFAIAVILFVATEFVVGWWALPLVGVVLGLIGARRTGVVVQVAAAALAAWLALFAWTAVQGNLFSFLNSLASSMQQKPSVLFGLLFAIPPLLAGPAAQIGKALRPAPAPTPVAAGTAAAVAATK